MNSLAACTTKPSAAPESPFHAHRTSVTLEMRPGRGVLVVDPQGIGDAISSLPLLKAVCDWSRSRWPVYVLFRTPDRFDLISKENLPLYPLYMESSGSTLRDLLSLWQRLRGKIDVVIGVPEIAENKLIILKVMTGAKYLIAEARPFFRRWMSAAVDLDWQDSFLGCQDKIAEILGISTPLPPPSISVGADELEWAQETVTSNGCSSNWPLIGVQCSALIRSKTWPQNSFAAVIDLLRQQFPEIAVVSFGTANERDAAHSVRASIPAVAWVEGGGRWSIRQSLAMLRKCDVFVSGDTGIMHMAAAVGARTVSVFGPTSPRRRAPSYNGGIALHPDTQCHPCYRGQWKSVNCSCIEEITPKSVFQAVLACLGRPHLV